MSESPPIDAARIRAEAAAEERTAILEIIERSMRRLSHGHGANGAQILQQIVADIHRRAERDGR